MRVAETRVNAREAVAHQAMLLRFSAENHRSILDPIELSFVALDDDRPAARSVGSIRERVLTVSALYGANASGKSNVLDALRWLVYGVRSSLTAWGEGVPREPFASEAARARPSVFEAELAIDGVRHAYVLHVDDVVRFEALYSFPARRQRTLFERDENGIHLRRGLGAATGLQALLTPTTLALSAMRRLRSPEGPAAFAKALARATIAPGGPAGLFLRSLRWGDVDFWSLPPGAGEEDLRNTGLDLDRSSASHAERRDRALALLRLADESLDEVRVVQRERPMAGPSQVGSWELEFLHRLGAEQVALGPEAQSAGTLVFLGFVPQVVRALDSGGLLVVDELDTSLHPVLSARVVELFQDPSTNPHGAQLLFSTHDTSLLGHLNRDEVWLVGKRADGATELHALADFGGERVRRSLNLERAYLQGRFGGLPEVDQVRVRQALGLVPAP